MYFGWKPYVSVAQRRMNAEREAKRQAKKGTPLSPVALATRTIANTFWGKSWCENLERYSDYENRLPRGRAYVRNGSVIDLRIEAGQIKAQVIGSSLYKIHIEVAALPKTHWQRISKDCAGSIDTLVELLQGRLSDAVMERICRPATGLFPSPREIKLSCSCPDWADMCKHVAAVLYGTGARLDAQPDLLFTLRKVDAQDLVASAGAGLSAPKDRPATAKVLEHADSDALSSIFGIDIARDERAGDAALPAPRIGKKRKTLRPSTTSKARKQPHGRKATIKAVAKRRVTAAATRRGKAV